MSYRKNLSNGTAVIDHDKVQKVFKKKSDAELRFIIKDAKEALQANPETKNASVYNDEVHYAVMELSKRQGYPRQLAGDSLG